MATCRDAWSEEPPFAIYEPGSRTIYSSGLPFTATAMGRVLDALVQIDRERAAPAPPEPTDKPTRSKLSVIQGGKPSKPR